VRAVIWLLLYKRLPFDLVPINPGSKGDNGRRSQAYLAKNPTGKIPTLEEPDTGFVLGEAHAILCYLSNKHGWEDVYPADPQRRAKVDWYLHYHHRNLREASIGLVALAENPQRPEHPGNHATSYAIHIHAGVAGIGKRMARTVSLPDGR
jgi:glutathione S-transferase